MSFIESLRQKPREQKIKLVWLAAFMALCFMLIVWVATSGLNKQTQADTTLFQTVGRGIKDIKENYKK